MAVGLLYSNSAKSHDKPPERLVAVGDVHHGDFDDLCLLLKRTGLVDAQNRWTGGSATLVQTADLLDRGPKGRQAMDLLMELEKEAAKAGGQVVPLLGNSPGHEQPALRHSPLHGGISPNLISMKLEQINSQVQEEVGEFDKTKEYLMSRELMRSSFTVQEVAMAIQAQLIADGAGETSPDAEYQARPVRLLGFDRWLCMPDDGPLWFRGVLRRPFRLF
ncbi:MAG TPA: hypothetical protein VMO76_12860 [Candidatus Udaeobacter sp.]|nr:hypothetical protein [Candidatus Udaeobacter sp.]